MDNLPIGKLLRIFPLGWDPFLVPLLFLIDTNDLAKMLLLSVTHEINLFANEFNNYLAKINNWDFKWKINFNPDRSKQAQEVVFSQKSKKITLSSRFFNNILATQSSSQKQSEVILEDKLKFCKYLKMMTSKIDKIIRQLGKLQKL